MKANRRIIDGARKLANQHDFSGMIGFSSRKLSKNSPLPVGEGFLD
jgi:hypothetical protein